LTNWISFAILKTENENSSTKTKIQNKNMKKAVETLSNNVDFDKIGWKSYNLIRRKTTEAEFSWSGLIISLLVAFFIVFVSAQLLNLFYYSFEIIK